MNSLADVQSSTDKRNLPIHQVGIKDLRFPIQYRSQNTLSNTVALFTMTVFLPAEQKGTHMSRFVALLHEYNTPLDRTQLRVLTQEMLARLDSPAGKISVSFPFFRQKCAPVTGITSLMDYDVTLTGEVKNGTFSGSMSVQIPVTSLCPCSKEISAYGAHNQRSCVRVSLTSCDDVAVEEVIDWVEAQASCDLYGLLKRPDEKFVTEFAYDHPKFVEDIVRDIAAVLRQDTRIDTFCVESENFESIHNHSAYAMIQYP